jgi:hypothetical protein
MSACFSCLGIIDYFPRFDIIVNSIALHKQKNSKAQRRSKTRSFAKLPVVREVKDEETRILCNDINYFQSDNN